MTESHPKPLTRSRLKTRQLALLVHLDDARGVAPTWYGEILVRHARLALSEISLAHEEIAALKAGLAGKAAIGTVVNPGTNLVPMAVARVKQKHPAILISVDID